jgi:hypothetical protein
MLLPAIAQGASLNQQHATLKFKGTMLTNASTARRSPCGGMRGGRGLGAADDCFEQAAAAQPLNSRHMVGVREDCRSAGEAQ